MVINGQNPRTNYLSGKIQLICTVPLSNSTLSNLTEFVTAFVTQHFCSVILKSLDLRHVNDDSNTN